MQKTCFKNILFNTKHYPLSIRYYLFVIIQKEKEYIPNFKLKLD